MARIDLRNWFGIFSVNDIHYSFHIFFIFLQRFCAFIHLSTYDLWNIFIFFFGFVIMILNVIFCFSYCSCVWFSFKYFVFLLIISNYCLQLITAIFWRYFRLVWMFGAGMTRKKADKHPEHFGHRALLSNNFTPINCHQIHHQTIMTIILSNSCFLLTVYWCDGYTRAV